MVPVRGRASTTRPAASRRTVAVPAARDRPSRAGAGGHHQAAGVVVPAAFEAREPAGRRGPRRRRGRGDAAPARVLDLDEPPGAVAAGTGSAARRGRRGALTWPSGPRSQVVLRPSASRDRRRPPAVHSKANVRFRAGSWTSTGRPARSRSNTTASRPSATGRRGARPRGSRRHSTTAPVGSSSRTTRPAASRCHRVVRPSWSVTATGRRMASKVVVTRPPNGSTNRGRVAPLVVAQADGVADRVGGGDQLAPEVVA